MQALRALVVIMGVMIIAGMGLLVYGMMTQISRGDETEQSAAAKAFGNVASSLPAGAVVAGVSVDDGRAVVHVRLARGGAEVRIFDLDTGMATGMIQLKAAP